MSNQSPRGSLETENVGNFARHSEASTSFILYDFVQLKYLDNVDGDKNLRFHELPHILEFTCTDISDRIGNLHEK